MVTETKKSNNAKVAAKVANKAVLKAASKEVAATSTVDGNKAKVVTKTAKTSDSGMVDNLVASNGRKAGLNKKEIPVGVASFRVKLVRSASGHTERQKATVRGLGLKKIGQEKELIDTPSSRGMAHAVRHLVKIV